VVSSIVALFVPGAVGLAQSVLHAFSSVHSLFTGSKTKVPVSPWRKYVGMFLGADTEHVKIVISQVQIV